MVERACPLCGSNEQRSLFTDVNRREGLALSCTLVECKDCGMSYVNPAPSGASLTTLYGEGLVDPVSEDVAAVQPVANRPPPASRLRATLHQVNGLFRGHPHDWPEEPGRGRSLLDFGCHNGEKLTFWYQRGWRVSGVDLNQPAIAAARKRFPEGRFWCGDVLEMAIGERFDVIRVDNVIEHLLDPLAYLAALVALLKPGGRLRVFVPNLSSLSARLLGRYSYVFWMPFHVNLFTSRTLHRTLERTGLSDIECKAFAPVGSWVHSQRQLLLPPGFNRRPARGLDRALLACSLLNYPGETLVQWLGLGDEVIGTGARLRREP